MRLAALALLVSCGRSPTGGGADAGGDGPALESVGGAWSSGGALPETMQEHGVAALEGRIHAVGGLNGFAFSVDTHAAFHPEQGWSRKPALPSARDHAAVAAVAGKLYVAGGSSGFEGCSGAKDTLFEFDPAAGTGAWTSRAAMPDARWAAAATESGGRLFVTGGCGGAEHRRVLVYDPAGDAWTAGAEGSAEREHHAAAAVGGRVFVFGGRWQGINTDTVEAYDPAGDAWSARAPMPTGRGGIAAAVLGGRVFVMGGEAFSPDRAFDTVEVYDPAQDRWFSAPPLPSPRHGFGAAALNGKIFAPGGGNRAGLAPVDGLFIYAP